MGHLRRSQTADRHGSESQQLSPNDMIAPVSAVHSMSVNLLGTNDVSLLMFVSELSLNYDEDIHGTLDQR